MWCNAIDINDAGQVLGKSDMDVLASDRSFVWEKGVTTDLGSLGGGTTDARDINNHGQVVGVGPTAAGEWHAFPWEHGVMTELGIPGGMGGRLQPSTTRARSRACRYS